MKSTKFLLALTCAIAVSGCSTISSGTFFNALDQINDSNSQIFGLYQAPTLAPSPRPSGCARHDQRCLTLDETEANLYAKARQSKITWRQLVDEFYLERARQFPRSNDSYGATELAAYQRVLADRMDMGQISETEWVYFIEKKLQEMSSQRQASEANAAAIRHLQQPQPHQAPAAPKNCWTTKSGNSFFTTCN